MDTVLSICLGVALSAACGFRIFVPMLIVSIASLTGHLELADSFKWIGTWPALICFLVATVAEIAAYYVPWLDNLLDSLAGPVAVVAGIVITASVVTGMDPFLKWTLAIIAGGGAAGIVQGMTTATRLTSSVTTAGIANPFVSTAEVGSSAVLSLLAVLFPLAAGVVAFLLLFFSIRIVSRRLRSRKEAENVL